MSVSPECAFFSPVAVLGGMEKAVQTIWIRNRRNKTNASEVIILTKRKKILIQEYMLLNIFLLNLLSFLKKDGLLTYFFSFFLFLFSVNHLPWKCWFFFYPFLHSCILWEPWHPSQWYDNIHGWNIILQLSYLCLLGRLQNFRVNYQTLYC